MLDIAPTKAVIRSIAEQIRREEAAVESSMGDFDSKQKRTPLSTFYGLIRLYPDTDQQQMIPIWATNDDSYFDAPGLSRHDLPIAINAIAARTTDGKLVIFTTTTIQKWLELDESDYRQNIAHGIICHEIGHILAGHLVEGRNSKAILDHITDDEFERLHKLSGKGYDDYLYKLIAEGLVKGATFGIEWEADVESIKVGKPENLILVHLFEVEFSGQLGIRFEKMNRVLRHYRNLIEGRYDKIEKVPCDIMTFTPEEIQEIVQQ